MTSRLVRRRIFLASITVGAAGAACAPPIQSGGVEVRSGAAERLGMVCRWRHGTTEGAGLCAEADEPVAAARVKRLAGPADALAGPLAAGRVGDLVIENGEIAVVIDQLGRGNGFAESGGNIVDAADARARRDELGQIFTYFGVFPRQAVYDALDSGVDVRGTAWIEARGHELYEDHLRVTTRYELAPGQRALLIQTTLVNETSAPVTGLELGDVIQWGSAEKFAMGKEPGLLGIQALSPGDYTGPWIAAAGRSAAYAILDADPRATAGLTAKNGTAWSNISFVRGVAIAPGARASYARVLVVAPRGDTLGAATEVFYLRGGAPGGLEIALTDAAGARIAPPEGGRFFLARVGEDPAAAAPLWLGVSAEAAKSGTNAAAEAPPGRYLVTFSGAGRHEIAAVPVTIESGHAAAIKLAVSDAGALRLGLIERRVGASTASPGKSQTRTGRTGYFDQYRFDPALGVGAAPGYDARFDAVEVWSGRYVKARSGVLDDLFALLRTSHPVTPTANTDTHGIFGQEAGYPRTYVRVADDDPARLDPADLAAGLRIRRDVVLTNGPFVTIRVGDVEQGGLVTLPKQGATLSIHVERAPWIDVTELSLRVGSVVQTVPLAGKPGPSGALIDDVEARLVRPGQSADPKARGLRAVVAEDTFVIVEVRGQKPLEPVLTGDPAEIQPFAITSPLWIDADGDGQSLGRAR